MSKKINVGIIGCGNISEAYLTGAKNFPIMQITACADINMEAAKIKAGAHNIEAMSVENLLEKEDIEIILNITTPQAHTEINIKALHAGKHVHCEKPFAIIRDDGKKVLDLAEEKNLLVGCAPDTFLGGGLQTCRKIIDDGEIGKPVAGTAFMMSHGVESWHPNPGFYYLKGGGPMLDMGPYYITALINLLGPVKKVCAISAMPFNERIATSKEQAGKILPVEVPTHVAGTLEFQSGAVITLVMSFDVWKHSNHNIEIHGEEGSMQVPDPNGFGGDVNIYKPGNDGWQSVLLSHGYTDNMRSIGVADMAYAIRYNRKNRCSGELAYHVLDVMLSLIESGEIEKFVNIESTVEQPAALPTGLKNGEMDK